MFNFFKDKQVIEFTDNFISGKNFYESLSNRLIEIDESGNLNSSALALKRLYSSTYLFHTLNHFKSVGNIEKFKKIEAEVITQVDSSIYSAYMDIYNHISNEDFPFLNNTAQWILSKYRFSQNLKALILAHQYIMIINSLEADYWRIFNLPSYSTESFVELFINREKNKKLATLVLIELIHFEISNIKAYLNYKNLDITNCNRVILMSDKFLSNRNEMKSNEILEFIIRCDPLHHYARGVGDFYAQCGRRIQNYCELLKNLVNQI